MTAERVIEISGAGPAGLAAAIVLARRGHHARVYERRADVGGRFHGDFQGLENWTTQTDVLEDLKAQGIESDFEHTPFNEVICFGPSGDQRILRSERPLFYLVRRGNQVDTLDQGLKNQALAAGVEIRFAEAASHFPHGGLVTEGPHRADAIATGYLFETDRADGAYVVVSEDLAAKGYSYLLICKGRATIATCLFADFRNQKQYLDRSVAFFEEHVGVRVTAPRRFGGSGNFALPKSVFKGNILYAGEAAGLQDPLFGFGIRCALTSGALAGEALANRDPLQYETALSKRLKNAQKTAATNRWFYERFNKAAYIQLVKQLPDGVDIRERLRRQYAPNLWKQIWYDLVVARTQRPLLDLHDDCDCTWCRCERHPISDRAVAS